MNIEEEAFQVCIGIDRYGGGFMQGLAQAIMRADCINLQKIKDTWSNEWNKYYIMGAKK